MMMDPRFFKWAEHKLNTMTNIAENFTINGKSIDGLLGIWTRDGRMVGAKNSSELCQPPHVMDPSLVFKA